MLHENQIPESSETPEEQNVTPEEQPTKEDPVAQDKSTEEVASPVEETSLSEEPVSQEFPTEEPSIEAPETEAEPSEETPAGEEPPAAVAEAETEGQEEAKEESPEKAEASEATTPETPAIAFDLTSLPPLNQEVVTKMEDILKDHTGGHHILAGATTSDLIHLMHGFLQAENAMALSAKVGLVKRTYDTLKYKPDHDQALGEVFLQHIASFNKKRGEQKNALDNARGINSQRKRELIVKLREVVEKKDPQLIQEVRAIQDEWKVIGQVIKSDIEPLYAEYRGLLNEFYELREVHFELLDYDRKINLQEKERLINEAEALIPPEEDWNNAEVWREKMDLLSEIQQQWKAAGHVPREEMDRINDQYRTIIDRFFEIRQGFMEVQEQQREENGVKKQAILEQMLPFADFTSEKPRIWNEATKELRAHQEAWKAIGQAPQSINGELWSKYREVCNTFFSNKSAFFTALDEKRSGNLEAKRTLVEKAEELIKGSNRETIAKELKHLQKEWKTIGPVPDRHSNKLWNRFREACDTFFQERRSHYKDVHKEERENLAAKKALIEEVKAVDVAALGSPQAAIQKIKDIQARWKDIGRVPYKEKDTIWDAFRETVDAFFNGLSLKREELRNLKMESTLESASSEGERVGILRGKISRLRNKISQAQSKVDQYSNNILFIAKGKKGDALRNQIQGEIEKEERLIKDWKKEIKKFNDWIKNPPQPEEPKEEPKAEAPVAEAPETASEEVAKEQSVAQESPAEETAAQEETTTEAPVAEEVEEEASPEAEAEAETPAEGEAAKSSEETDKKEE